VKDCRWGEGSVGGGSYCIILPPLETQGKG
jgi:hypothetical protein